MPTYILRVKASSPTRYVCFTHTYTTDRNVAARFESVNELIKYALKGNLLAPSGYELVRLDETPSKKLRSRLADAEGLPDKATLAWAVLDTTTGWWLGPKHDMPELSEATMFDKAGALAMARRCILNTEQRYVATRIACWPDVNEIVETVVC